MESHIVLTSSSSSSSSFYTTTLGNTSQLERERTINSIDLQEERRILWEIKRVEKIKKQVDAYDAHDKLIKDKKVSVIEV